MNTEFAGQLSQAAKTITDLQTDIANKQASLQDIGSRLQQATADLRVVGQQTQSKDDDKIDRLVAANRQLQHDNDRLRDKLDDLRTMLAQNPHDLQALQQRWMTPKPLALLTRPATTT